MFSSECVCAANGGQSDSWGVKC